MDAQKSSQDIRVRNVSFHRRGKPEHGTLYLTKHHLIFQYQPGNTGSRSVSSPQASTTSSSTNLTKLAGDAGPHEHVSKTAEASQTPQKVNGKHQKEVYVPFPMIHHCILRPSTALSSTQPVAKHPDALLDDEELFPPTIGTSSYTRPSTDSVRGTPSRQSEISTLQSARPPAIRIRCKDFAIFALHFNGTSSDKTPDESARQVFHALRSRCCVTSMEDMYAFQFKPPAQEVAIGGQPYDARQEFARMGIRSKAPDGPGSAWRITDINSDYQYSPTYPSVIAVPRIISDNILKYSGSFRSKSRIPALAYLHPNGGSITRSSQPLVGVQGKRNPQDEKLVMAVFSSHTPSSADIDQTLKNSSSSVSLHADAQVMVDAPNEDESVVKQRIYGSTRRNYIVDARPKLNMMANKAGGGGIEDVANYSNGSDALLERVFLGIANIHVMRSSLDKVVEALGSSDYLDLAPNQDLLRKSGWLGHIANMLSGAEMVARVVGLGGSHALIHCSDGWDRTAQISALAQLMLDPRYRTISGFITLVQKDFLSFGHKFKHRQGTEGSEKWFEIENERIAPARSTENGAESNSNIQAFGSKALTGARTWFEKNKNTIFRQQSPSSGASDISRPTTPPGSNPIIHSSPTPAVKDEKHKMDEKEVAPIFHQFLECVYQLLYQEPSAFEFNERFLRRLLYQSYSGQYGEFLFSNEKERLQYQGRTGSVWANLLARKHEFINADYVLKTNDPLLLPRRQGYDREIEVRWWHTLFGRKDEEMNIPRSLATETVSANMSSLSLENDPAVKHSDDETAAAATVRSVRSTSALKADIEPIAAEPTPAKRHEDINTAQKTMALPVIEQHATAVISPTDGQVERQSTAPDMMSMDVEEGDPLGVSAKPTTTTASLRGGLDFAAFARSNAFSER